MIVRFEVGSVCYNHVSMNLSGKSHYALAAVAVDLLTLVIAIVVLSSLTERMITPNGVNALLVAGTFFLFAGGIFIIRRMKAAPDGTSDWLTKGQRSALALFFAFIFSLMLAWQLGFFRSVFQVDTTQMGEGGSASYFLFGPGAWLAFSLLYVLVFAFKVKPAIEYGRSRYWLAAVFGLVTTALMLLVMVAQANVIAATIGAAWWGIITFAVLVGLFLPPRFLYLSRVAGLKSVPSYAATISILILLAILAAQMI